MRRVSVRILTWRIVVSVRSWISSSSDRFVTMSQTLLYSMMITRCLCVEHLARLALELNNPPVIGQQFDDIQ